jgi:RNA polymerase sigma factor (sigma-70 family)
MQATALTEGERNRLIIENADLVARIASEYRGRKGIPFEDLEAEGMLGLVRATQSWERRAKFTTYATHWIKGSIRQLIDRWENLDRLDENSQGMEDRIFEWQAWGVLPSEGWTSLTATPEEIRVIYETIEDKTAAAEAAMISLDPRERRLVIQHFIRSPRMSLDQVARDNKMSYHAADKAIYRAVMKMREVVKRILDNRSGSISPRTGRSALASRVRGYSSTNVIPFEVRKRAAH